MTRVFGINPNKTTAGGSCGPQLVTLELRSDSVSLLAFQFGMVRLPLPRSLEALVSEPGRASLCRPLWLFLLSPLACCHAAAEPRALCAGWGGNPQLCLCEEGGVCFLCLLFFFTGVLDPRPLPPSYVSVRSVLVGSRHRRRGSSPPRSAQPPPHALSSPGTWLQGSGSASRLFPSLHPSGTHPL